ncbi:hypothetical protein TTHERM_00312560 (macronuclear) [Tetrahymena thermophila SB210]|uniref:Uncharacterized protein n=1 Tax=Tetrahymena thermophila (strain SB210) TaxID=312017 RepID=Q22KM5_TETTS|nr:hypothetical protein TTHERM_00312560 [Tetrahymena thermophila SB210]EAR85774.2 hypothetical protein TTHERM_00312560 [Tetrahymena thermophila SB210]|eukprot:XP_001033437.2 hypothetical protein TTHERM_00312560 [Tetrahymena thermophila SB210]
MLFTFLCFCYLKYWIQLNQINCINNFYNLLNNKKNFQKMIQEESQEEEYKVNRGIQQVNSLDNNQIPQQILQSHRPSKETVGDDTRPSQYSYYTSDDSSSVNSQNNVIPKCYQESFEKELQEQLPEKILNNASANIKTQMFLDKNDVNNSNFNDQENNKIQIHDQHENDGKSNQIIKDKDDQLISQIRNEAEIKQSEKIFEHSQESQGQELKKKLKLDENNFSEKPQIHDNSSLQNFNQNSTKNNLDWQRKSQEIENYYQKTFKINNPQPQKNYFQKQQNSYNISKKQVKYQQKIDEFDQYLNTVQDFQINALNKFNERQQFIQDKIKDFSKKSYELINKRNILLNQIYNKQDEQLNRLNKQMLQLTKMNQQIYSFQHLQLQEPNNVYQSYQKEQQQLRQNQKLPIVERESINQQNQSRFNSQTINSIPGQMLHQRAFSQSDPINIYSHQIQKK